MPDDDFIINQTRFALLPRPSGEHPRGDTLTIVVKGMWTIAPGAEPQPLDDEPVIEGMRFVDAQDPHSGPLSPDEIAFYKPRCDLIVVGSAHAPGGKPVTAMPVAVHCGTVKKQLSVIGPRSWQRGALGARMGEPAPFTSMPLDWSMAFGGPGSAANPSGRGLGGDELPCLERPGKLIGARGDRPEPICFAPLNPLWPAREKILRKTSIPRDWIRQVPRRMPVDFDWSYLQDAPPDQQRSYLTGDEELRLIGLHPEAQDWKLHLPGQRPRVVIRDYDEHGRKRERECPLNCDTCIIDSDAGTLALIWRGILPIAAANLEAIERIACVAEPVAGEPTPTSALIPLLDPPPAEAEEESGPAPYEPAAVEDQELAEEPLDGPWTREQFEEAVTRSDDLSRGDFRSAQIGDVSAPGISLAGADCSWASFAGADLAGADLSGAVLVDADFAGANLRGANLAGAHCLRCCFDRACLAEADLSGLILQEGSANDADLSGATAAGFNAYNGSLQRIRAEGLQAPDAVLDYADLTEANLRGANLQNASAGEADLVRVCLAQADCSGAHLADCIADDIDLTQAILAGASLAHTSLPRAKLVEADLSGCDAVGIFAREIDGTRVQAPGADFTQADFLKADLSGAIFAEANLDRARLDRINAPDLDLSRASGDGLSLREAHTPHARLDDAMLAKLRARGWQAPDASAAKLRVTDFSDCSRCVFTRMIAPAASFVQCSLSGSDLTAAELPGAAISKCRLTNTRLHCTDLSGVNFVESELSGCDLRQSKLTQACFNSAVLERCIFDGAMLVHADFGNCDCRESFFEGARMEGTLRG